MLQRLFKNRGLVLICVVVAGYLFFATWYALVLPPGAGPDEAEHIRYVEILRSEHAFPLLPGWSGEDKSLQALSAQHPPLYYLVLAIVSLPFASPQAGFGLYALRIASVLMGAAALCFVLCTARRLWPSSLGLVAAAGIFGLFPNYQYMTAVVNNSTGVILASALTLWAMVCILTAEKDTVGHWLALGLAVAVGVASKLTAVWLMVPAAGCLIYCARNREYSTKKLLGIAATVFVPAILVAALWMGRSMMLYGMLVPQSVTQRSIVQDNIFLLVPGVWGTVGWYTASDVFVGLATPFWLAKPHGWQRWWVGWPLVILFGIAIAGYIRAAMRKSTWLRPLECGRGRQPSTLDPAEQIRSVLARLCGWGFAVAWLIVIVIMLRDFGALNYGGRYMQSTMPAVGMIWAVGYSRLLKTDHLRRTVLSLIFTLLLWAAMFWYFSVLTFQTG
ncbi:MAG: glycosyltransferase family 39 protein [Armatimonadota bacterium]